MGLDTDLKKLVTNWTHRMEAYYTAVPKAILGLDEYLEGKAKGTEECLEDLKDLLDTYEELC